MFDCLALVNGNDFTGVTFTGLQYFSESCFGNDNKFLLPNPLSCFVFHLPNLLLTQNLVYPTLFSSVPPPAINNERSLIGW